MKNLPKGWLVTQHRGKSRIEYYLHTYNSGKREVKYLSGKKDALLIGRLQYKKEQKKKLQDELALTIAAINKNKPIVEEIIANIEIPNISYPPSVSQNPIKRQYLTYKTNRGEFVRSKSEKIIADALFSLNVNYRYEETLCLNNAHYHPDFTIISPLNGETYYWEHLGLLNDAEYVNNWLRRKNMYEKHGITLGKNLIVTVEKQINYVEDIAKQKFSLQRYRSFFTPYTKE